MAYIYQQPTRQGVSGSSTSTSSADQDNTLFYKKEDFKSNMIMLILSTMAGIILYLFAWWIVVEAGGSGWMAKLLALLLSFVFMVLVSFGAKLLTKSEEVGYFWFAVLMALVTFLVMGFIQDSLPKPSFGAANISTIAPRVSRGWKINKNGEVVASLSVGEETSRVFNLPEGYYSPWIVIPPGNYRYSFSHMETVLIEDGRGTHIVNPEDFYDMGERMSQRFRFRALKGGAKITLQAKR